MAAGDLGALRDEGWDRLQERVARFEAAWIRGERPRIADHLPVDESGREALLLELVHAELEFRIKGGEPARVEDYLRRHPSLGLDRRAVLGLIRAEWTLRRRREPNLTLDRFRARFPGFGDDLEAGDPSAEPPSPGPDPPPPGPAEGPLPRRLGKFDLRERVGAGAFGVVYRAWDTVLGREVALKVPRPEAMASPSDLRLFLREARNAIDLRHPHIVAIHDAGPIEGTACLVRAFVEGATLAERLQEATVTPGEAAALMIPVLDALGYAHGRGIVHRDLKPSNILLDRAGRPHVSDFGLAKRGAGDSTLTPAGQVGTMIGTPAYMSPEQARGEAHLVDARSDLYSAGVVLYELLTGSLPFRGRGRMLQVQIQGAAPTPPRSLNDDVPPDLEAICLRAMAKSPPARYPTARAMADDLRRFLDGLPIAADPVRGRDPAPGPRRRYLAAVAMALVGLAGLAGLWAEAEARRRSHAGALAEAVSGMEELAGLVEAPGLDEPEAHRRLVDAIHARSVALLGRVEPDGDPALREALARGLARLADRESSIGSDRVAAGLWARAVRLGEEAARGRPGDLALDSTLARAHSGLGGARARLGAPAEAARSFDRALGLRGGIREARRRRAEDHPDDPDLQLDRAEAEVEAALAGIAAGHRGDFAEAEATLDRLARRPPPGEARRRRLGRLALAIARGQLDGREPSQALRAASRSRRLAESAPGGPAGVELARSLLASASATRDLGRADEASEEFRRAAGQLEALPLDDPSAVSARRDLGEALSEAGRLMVGRPDRRDEGVAALRRALRVRSCLRRDHPESHADAADLAATWEALGSALEATGPGLAAASAYLRALAHESAAVALAPGAESHRRDLARQAGALARLARSTLGIPRARAEVGAPD